MKYFSLSAILALAFVPSLASAQILLTGGGSTDGFNAASLGTVVLAVHDGGSSITLQGITFAGLGQNVRTTGAPTIAIKGTGATSVVTPDTASNAGFTDTTDTADNTALLGLVNGGIYSVNDDVIISIFGAQKNTTYTFNLFTSADGNAARSLTVQTEDGTGSPITENIGSTNGIYDEVYTATSDSSGNLQIDVVGTSSIQGIVSGILVTEAAAIPEPSTWAMLLVGVGVLGFLIRERKSASRA